MENNTNSCTVKSFGVLKNSFEEDMLGDQQPLYGQLIGEYILEMATLNNNKKLRQRAINISIRHLCN